MKHELNHFLQSIEATQAHVFWSHPFDFGQTTLGWVIFFFRNDLLFNTNSTVNYNYV